MACFLVSAGEAAVAAAVRKGIEHKEKRSDQNTDPEHISSEIPHIPFSRKLKWLINMLLGGAVLLAFEHLWHGEVVPWPPFLTAMSDPADTAEMLNEMATVGVTMAVIITSVWCLMLVFTHWMETRVRKEIKNILV